MTEAAPEIASRRRYLAILFADLSGSTRIAGSMEPEHYAGLLQEIRSALEAAVARHGGEIVRIDGDGALCIFGWPGAPEDAARRAVETALDFTERLKTTAAGDTIQMHCGIHAGIVLVRDGDLTRGRFEMLGDATNVAVRVGDAAEPGEILISDEALGADRHQFRTGPPRLLPIAGRADALAIVPILGRETARTRLAARAQSGLTHFAGRGSELDRLDHWFAAAQGGSPAGPAMLVGPAGIGKSRLLGEYLDRLAARGVVAHRGYCESYLTAPPLQPLDQLYASLAARTPDPLAGAEIGEHLSPLADHGTVTPAALLRAAIDREAARGVCLFVIDDWQWADDATRHLLGELLARPDRRIRFLLASRTADAKLEVAYGLTRIDVPPLDDYEAAATITRLLATQDPFMAARIREQAGGNPLFIEELCHASRRLRGKAAQAGAHAWLDMLTQARFARLDPHQARLVRVAAVIGHAVPASLFAALTGVAEGDPMLAELAEADFLYPGEIAGTLRFKHGITRDAIYRVVELAERKALHCQVAGALMASDDRDAAIDAIAWHCTAGGDFDRAIPASIKAGDAALAAGALDRARAHFAVAFDCLVSPQRGPPDPTLVWKLVNKYGLACIADPSPEQMPVLAAMAARLEQLDHVEALMRSRYWLGVIAYGLGDCRRSAAHLEIAHAQATAAGRDSFALLVEIKLAQSRFAAGDYARADTLFAHALPRLAAGAGRNHAETLGYALCCHGFLYADRGAFDAADRCYAEAATILADAAPSMRASYLTQRAAVCLMAGDWAGARAYAADCLDLCGITHARYQAMMARALQAYAAWRGDRDQGAPGALAEVASWLATDASRQRTSLLFGWLADVFADTDRPAHAMVYARAAVHRVRVAGDRLGEAMAYRALARLAAAGQARHGPDHYLTRARRSAVIRGSARELALTDLCEAGLVAGDKANECRTTLAHAALTAFERIGMPGFAADARTLLSASR